MEYGLFAIAMIGVLLAHLELTKWKERVRAQQKQIDELCRAAHDPVNHQYPSS